MLGQHALVGGVTPDPGSAVTRAQLATPNPVPAVTISASGDALENPYGMALDPWGNLWVVGNAAGKVYEYARWQLARSGSPTPVTTLRDFPGTPLGDAFDPRGDLWVTIQPSTSGPQGCVVEFSRAELDRANPTAHGYDLFDRWCQHVLHARGGHVHGHRRGVGLLRHAL